MNVQVDLETNEMLKILKKQQKVHSMADVIKALIIRHHPDVTEVAKRRAAEMLEITGDVKGA